MSWMRIVTMALGVVTLIAAYTIVPLEGRTEVVGAGAAMIGWALRWPGDVSITEVVK